MDDKNEIVKVFLVEAVVLTAAIVILSLSSMGLYGEYYLALEYLLDLPTLLILLLLSLPTLIASGLWKDFVKVFSLGKREYTLSELKRTKEAVGLLQKQIVYAAVLVGFYQTIVILHRLTDATRLGPMVSVMCVGGLYTVILEFLLMPLKVLVQKRIIEYME